MVQKGSDPNCTILEGNVIIVRLRVGGGVRVWERVKHGLLHGVSVQLEEPCFLKMYI